MALIFFEIPWTADAGEALAVFFVALAASGGVAESEAGGSEVVEESALGYKEPRAMRGSFSGPAAVWITGERMEERIVVAMSGGVDSSILSAPPKFSMACGAEPQAFFFLDNAWAISANACFLR